MRKIICFSLLIFSAFSFINVFSDSTPYDSREAIPYGTLTIKITMFIRDSLGIPNHSWESVTHKIYARYITQEDINNGLFQDTTMIGKLYTAPKKYKHGEYTYELTGFEEGASITISNGRVTATNGDPKKDRSRLIFFDYPPDGSLINIDCTFSRREQF